MSFGGPLPIPTAIKIAEGNPGNHKLPQSEPKPALLTDITPPGQLSEAAKMIWEALASDMMEAGLLAKADIYTFAKYCDSEALYWKFRAQIGEDDWVFQSHNKVGQEYRQVNPLAMLMHQAFQRAEKLAHHLGLSPAARARLGNVLDGKGDELDEFLKNED